MPSKKAGGVWSSHARPAWCPAALPGALTSILLLLFSRVLCVGRVAEAGNNDESCQGPSDLGQPNGGPPRRAGREGDDLDAPIPLRKKRNQPTPPPPRGLYEDPFFFFVLTPCVIGLSVVRIADDDEIEMMLRVMEGLG